MEELLWIPAGTAFGFDDLVHWQGKGERSFAQALDTAEAVVLGPHASAAFPRELAPFIAPGLSLRQQCDFSDCLTSPLGRAWAQADARVIFVENPHSRLVSDPNRAPSPQPLQDLRTCFARLAAVPEGGKADLSGVDGIRPITFSGQPVLLAPTDAAGWAALDLAWQRAQAQGVEVYRGLAQQVVQALLTAAGGQRPVVVLSLHDTMNTQMRADGALVVPRAPADRLPAWVNLGNRGDAQGQAVGQGQPTSFEAARLQRMAGAWQRALERVTPPVGAAPSVSLNQPYKGAFETQCFGALLQREGAAGSGAVQLEFLREALLGAAAVDRLHQPGTDWPAPDGAYLGRIAQALAAAGPTGLGA